MLRVLGALILLGLAACAAPVTPEVSPATPLAPPPAPAPRPPPSPSRLRPLFGDATAPVLFEPAAKLQLGMPMEQAQKAAPELFGETPYRPKGFSDVALSGEGDIYGHLSALVMMLPRDTALADVTGLWGEPVKGARSDAHWWFNPAARVRARLEEAGSRLVLERYFPIAELVGNSGERFGFEKESLIGMKGAQAAAAYRDYVPPDVGGRGAKPQNPDLCQSELLVLPPVEHDTTVTRVRVRCASEAVISYEVKIRYEGHLALENEIMRHLRRKLGLPVDKTDIMGRAVLEYAGASRRVRLLDDESVREVILTVMGRGAGSASRSR